MGAKMKVRFQFSQRKIADKVPLKKDLQKAASSEKSTACNLPYFSPFVQATIFRWISTARTVVTHFS